MTKRHVTRRRVLAIDPTYRGFGYVILEGADRLVDWGVCEVRTDKSRVILEKIATLVRMFDPDVLVVEDVSHHQCKRRDSARMLVNAIVAMARRLGTMVQCVPAVMVRALYREHGAMNKDAVARLIVLEFPESERLLPRPRKIWMPESPQMAVFDAMAFALVSTKMHSGRGPSHKAEEPRPEVEGVSSGQAASAIRG